MVAPVVTVTSSNLSVGSGAIVSAANSPFLVSSGGVLSAGTIISGGAVTIGTGGSDLGGTVISSGGTELVSAGGSANGDQVYGAQTVSSGGSVVNAETVFTGGTIALVGGGGGSFASGLVVSTGGLVTIAGSSIVSNTVVSGGTVTLSSAKAEIAGSLVFNGGTLLVSAVSSGGYGDQAVLSGLNTGAAISAAFISGGSITSATDNGTTTTVVIAGTSAGTAVSASFIIDDATAGITGGSGSAANFTVTDVGATTKLALACFAAGTRIRTEAGETSVEHLAAGDRVVTIDGHLRPIAWIGHRRVANPDIRQRPIRIAAHAMAPGWPQRDLFLSPDHAVFLEGVLVPIHALQDGDRIAPVPVDEVTYFHIMLETHDVIFAEGLPAETLLDDDTGRFDNDDVTQTDTMTPCAPIMIQGPRLEAIRRHLADYAPAAV